VYGNECTDPELLVWLHRWDSSVVRYEHVSNQTQGMGQSGTWIRAAIACIHEQFHAVCIAEHSCEFNASLETLF